ncbi:MAG: hypothetical protein QXY62_01455 [Candidatus Altiarchaeota archaeon]
MKVFCFGNEFLREDSLAKKISSELKIPGVEFVNCNSVEEIFQYANKGEILIMDVANVKKPLILQDIEKIESKRISTLHDFDLGFFLKLMKKLNNKFNVKIICIPKKGNRKKIAKGIENLLREKVL